MYLALACAPNTWLHAPPPDGVPMGEPCAPLGLGFLQGEMSADLQAAPG